MDVNVTSTNPEPTTFLMGAIVSELDNINQMLSSTPTRTSTGGKKIPGKFI